MKCLQLFGTSKATEIGLAMLTPRGLWTQPSGGLPHSRQRVCTVCLSQEATRMSSAPFLWPRPSTAPTPTDDLLQPTRGSDADLLALGPECRDRLLAYL